MEGSPHKYHEDQIAGKGMISLSHHNLVRKIIPVPQAMKNTRCKTCSGERMGKLKKILARQLTKVRNQKEVIAGARNEDRTVHFATLMDLCHLENLVLELQFQNCKGRVVLRGDTVKDDPGSYAVFTEQRIISITSDGCKSNGYYITTTRMRRTSSRRNICLHPGQNGRFTNVVQNSKIRNVQTCGFVYHDTNGLNHGPVWKTQSFLLKGICTVIRKQDSYGKGNSSKFC